LCSGGPSCCSLCRDSEYCVLCAGIGRLISEFHIELQMYSKFTACHYKSNSVQKLYRLLSFQIFVPQNVASEVKIDLFSRTPCSTGPSGGAVCGRLPAVIVGSHPTGVRMSVVGVFLKVIISNNLLEGVVGIGWSWLRIGTAGGHL
jgi:hypothetical protein